MLYMFQDHHTLAPEIAKTFYAVSLRWAAERGTAFLITLYPLDYRSPAEIARFTALGTATRLRRHGEDVVEITGAPGQGLLDALLESPMPAGALSGELCPVGDLQIFCGERIVYHVCDYGRDQLFDLTDDELTELSARLFEAGLGAGLLGHVPSH